MTRSKVTSESVYQTRWDAPGPDWHTVPGSTGDNCSITYSQDLVLTSNHGSQIRLGKLGRGYDLGGDFLCYRRNYEEYSTLGTGKVHFSPNTSWNSLLRPHYWSPQRAFRARVQNSDFPFPTPSDRTLLNALATKGIRSIAPNAPKADFSTFVGELREGFPHAVGIRDSSKERIRQARNAGDEYLNVEFGWKPLIRDLQKFVNSAKNADAILDEYYAGAGRKIRRRYDFEPEFSAVEVDLGNNTPKPTLATANYGSSAAGRLRRFTTEETRRWLVCTFVYYLPPRNSRQGWMKSANKLFGTDLTPRTLWNLAPWSWAADWVGNFGDIVDNVTFLNDNLVMPHCYMMEYKKVRHEYVLQGYGNQYRTYPGTHYFRQVFETEMKYRIAGTPYGFGLNWSSFSAKQLGILAALGVSRTH